jgi:protein TonB
VRESNPLSPRSLGDPLPEARRYSNARSASRALVSSSDVNDHGLSVARQGALEHHDLGVSRPKSVNGGARRTLFAGTETPTYTVWRGRGLLVAFALHVLALTPFLVSTLHVESQPTPAMEAVGVTFVMAPQRGVGTPAPKPEPEHQKPSSKPVKPIVPKLSTERPALTAKPLPSFVPTATLNVLPELASPLTDDAGGTKTVAATPAASTGSGGGGAANSPLPPAIGTLSGHSNWAGLVLGRLEQFKRYPAFARSRRQEGICYVRFTLDREGHVLGASLARTSGHASLDREAVALVRRADPLPAPSPELKGETVTLTVPVEFFLTR